MRKFLSLLFLLSTYFYAMPQSIGEKKPPLDLFEKVVVDTDRPFYLAGQAIRFKIYVISKSGQRIGLSKTAYAEIFDSKGAAVFQTRIRLDNGSGDGAFQIPGESTSGCYGLRVYTGAMRNRPQSIETLPLVIVNTRKAFDTAAFILVKGDTHPEKLLPSSVGESELQADGIRPVQNLLTVQPDKVVYQPRSKVNVKLAAAAGDTADVSVAVYRLNDLMRSFSHLDPVSASGATRAEAEETFLPDLNGFVVVAAVRDREGRAVAGIPLTFSLTGKLTDVQYGESDDNGLAYFNLKGVYGSPSLFLKTTAEFENKVQLQILKPYLSGKISLPTPRIRTDHFSALEEMHRHQMVAEAYQTLSDAPGVQNPGSISFYGKPDAVYLLDDYKRFVTMEEVLREYVREVSVRIRNKNFFILMLNKQLVRLNRYLIVSSMMDKYAPLLLIDGVPVTANQLMAYDPLKVRKLEVLTERYFLGKDIYDGILSFTTYRGDFADLQLEANELVTDIHAWQPGWRPPARDYSQGEEGNKHLPDFRELLLWEPNLRVTGASTLSFYTGDLEGEFLIVVKGMTKDGGRVLQTGTFKVEE